MTNAPMDPREREELKRHLHEFAERHGLLFQPRGECGFMRPCVGLLKHGKYVEYCPITDGPEYARVPSFDDDRLRPMHTDAPDAYHKHECFAVLASNDEDDEADYDEATRQLHAWIERLRKIGPLEVVSYPTGAVGLQAMISGTEGYAMRFVPLSSGAHDGK